MSRDRMSFMHTLSRGTTLRVLRPPADHRARPRGRVLTAGYCAECCRTCLATGVSQYVSGTHRVASSRGWRVYIVDGAAQKGGV